MAVTPLIPESVRMDRSALADAYEQLNEITAQVYGHDCSGPVAGAVRRLRKTLLNLVHLNAFDAEGNHIPAMESTVYGECRHGIWTQDGVAKPGEKCPDCEREEERDSDLTDERQREADRRYDEAKQGDPVLPSWRRPGTVPERMTVIPQDPGKGAAG